MMVGSPALNPASVPFVPPGRERTENLASDRAGPLTAGSISGPGERATTPSSLDLGNNTSIPHHLVASVPVTPSVKHIGIISTSPDGSSSTLESDDNGKAPRASPANVGPITAMPLLPNTGVDVPTLLQHPPKASQNGNDLIVDMRRKGDRGTAPNPTDVVDGEDTPGPLSTYQWTIREHTPSNNSLVHDQSEYAIGGTQSHQDYHHNRQASPPTNPGLLSMGVSARSPAFNMPFKSPSPVSSAGSVSVHTSSIDLHSAPSFEAQLKTSPIIRELLERLTRCEISNNAIQRELESVHRSINILVERVVSTGPMNGEPEFKNPFAPSASSRSLTPSTGIGPLQQTSPHGQPSKNDELTQISQRINTLTSSVGQLLALQTQQHMNSLSHTFDPRQSLVPQPSMDIAPNQIVTPPNQGSLMPLLSNRPDLRPTPRTPNPPMRTWSVGTLELPARLADPSMGRQDSSLRDKRKSVVNLARRDSSGMTDINGHGENWSSRDSGPLASKWDQLPLAPELLRSLTKFGVGPPNKIQQRALPFLLKGADIIAQAPPTQERIAAYVIPAINVAVLSMAARPINRGPVVVMISTTVDQATQAQRMIRDLGGPIGVRSALGVGTTGPNSDLTQELRLLQQATPHIICGTPQKLHALFTAPSGLSGSEVRFLVLDEVDQLIARNLHEYVFNIVRLLPAPRSRSVTSPGTSPSNSSTASSQFNSLDPAGTLGSPFQNNGRRFSAVASNTVLNPIDGSQPVERQTALFSNTVPQDVLNLANAIQLREPVRVLVRRDGNISHTESNQGARGLRQFYLYLAFTAGSRSDPSAAPSGGGHGIIGSGRGASNAETAQAREWKLDALVDLLEDVDVPQIIVHVGGMTALDAVVYKLANRGFEAVPLHGDMNAGTKLAALNKFRGPANTVIRQSTTKVLVVYDVQVKAPDVFQVPLVVNYDLPQAVEEYAHRVAPAISTNHSRAGVVVNFVTATGGDVEMLRSIECFYKIKCPEVPMSLRDLF